MSEPTKEELMARIAELEKQAGGKKSGKLEFKVGDKGGVSVYGLGRFPVTLYYEQWIRLLDSGDANDLPLHCRRIVGVDDDGDGRRGRLRHEPGHFPPHFAAGEKREAHHD